MVHARNTSARVAAAPYHVVGQAPLADTSSSSGGTHTLAQLSHGPGPAAGLPHGGVYPASCAPSAAAVAGVAPDAVWVALPLACAYIR